jgi:hypothetical protein
VRFASASARANADDVTTLAEQAPSSSPASTSVDAGSQRVLDQTWHALEPILNSIRENGERK